VNFEDIMLSEIRQTQKKNTVRFHIHEYEVPGVVRFIGTESRMGVAKGCGREEGRKESYRLTGSFSFAR